MRVAVIGISTAVLSLCVAFQDLSAPLVPRLDLPALCSNAELVVAGTVLQVTKAGRTVIRTPGGELGSDLMLAVMDVENVLKGELGESQVKFQFPLPDAPGGYGIVLPGEAGVFFLRRVSGAYEVVDFYHPYVVAALGVADAEGECVVKVIRRVRAVLEQGIAPPPTRRKALEVLETVADPLATAAIRVGTEDAEVNIRLLAVSALITRTDSSFVQVAVDTLISPPPDLDAYVVFRLAHAIEFGVKKGEAIPELARLLKANDVHARRAAVGALRSTGATAAIQPLAHALNDTDRQVQYQAVIGLAEITGAPSEWSPATDTFNQNPQKYLDYWRKWALANK